ncbi:MAG: hypothetical protein Kow0056_12120 [Coriobacteriia bacterium]
MTDMSQATRQADHAPMWGFALAWTTYRVAHTLILALVVATGLVELPSAGATRMFWAAIILFSLSPAILPFFALHTRMSGEIDRALRLSWYFLPLDLAALSALTYTFEGLEDPIYPLYAGLAVFYVMVSQRKRAAWVGGGIGLAYFFGHLSFKLVRGLSSSDMLIALVKAAAIPLLGLLLASWVEQRRERETAIEASKREIEQLDDELTRRLSELHIISEITEMIHSTLDFESISHVVLDSLRKAIDIPACSLMVIDRKTDETVFSADSGLENLDLEPKMTGYFTAPDVFLEPVADDSTFSCITLFEHNEMGVVFCCPADRLDDLSQDDLLVLQAVASELVVAVENSRLYQLTKRLSITDELTGLRNYRFLQQRLDQEYERANRYNRYLSLLMLDVDHFKGFNDSHGHIAGNRALADLAGVLKSCVREVDIVARYGGEEFSVILPETDAAGAFVVAEKIREAVAEFEFADESGERTGHLTVSVGVATFPVHALEREELLRQADDALYQAKHFGRNRVRAPRMAAGSQQD